KLPSQIVCSGPDKILVIVRRHGVATFVNITQNGLIKSPLQIISECERARQIVEVKISNSCQPRRFRFYSFLKGLKRLIAERIGITQTKFLFGIFILLYQWITRVLSEIGVVQVKIFCLPRLRFTLGFRIAHYPHITDIEAGDGLKILPGSTHGG